VEVDEIGCGREVVRTVAGVDEIRVVVRSSSCASWVRTR
jgi:hypothetical protein